MTGGRIAASLLVVVVSALAGCSAGSDSGAVAGPDGSRDLVDAISALGVDCSDLAITDAPELPYRGGGCVGISFDWIDDADEYWSLVHEDCTAAPGQGRAAPVVVGPAWVVRGADVTSPTGWPPRVGPADVARALDGTVMSVAEFCAKSRPGR